MTAPFAFLPTVTAAGAAAAAAGHVTLTDVGLGLGRYTPTGLETALAAELVRFPITGAMRVAPNSMRVAGVWNDPAREAPVFEVGFYSGDLLFAVWSRESASALVEKAYGMDLVFMSELLFGDQPDGNVIVENNPAVNAAMTALVEHEIVPEAHPQYLARADFVNAFTLATAEEVAGTGNDILMRLPGETVLTALTPGAQVSFVATAPNTGPVTVDVNELGAAPVVKLAGVPLDAGDLQAGGAYTMLCDGARWIVVTGIESGGSMLVTLQTKTYAAAAGQTTFAATYAPGWLMVMVNGRVLPPADYTASNGTSVVMGWPLAKDDAVQIIAFRQFTAGDAYTKAEGDARFMLKADLIARKDSGRIGFFACDTPPSGWLRANGAAVSRTVYADLFTAIGTTYGAGDGTTTFNLPDVRGEFLRGLDESRGVDAGRVLGSAQGDAFRAHGHDTVDGERFSHSPQGNAGTTYGFTPNEPGIAQSFVTGMSVGGETRPRNVALLGCIRY